MRRMPFAPLLLPILAVLALAAGCLSGQRPAAPPSLGLYPLDREPTVRDWRTLPPLTVVARGGQMVDPGLAWRMDQSLTHAANADCHHGPGAGGELAVQVSGFWTPRNVYLRIRWDDRTANDRFVAWRRVGDRWTPTGEREDGIALAWGEKGFPCHQSCHLADWEFTGGVWTPRYRMLPPTDPVPFWVWRAHRSPIAGDAQKGWFTTTKVAYLPTGPLFALNSALGGDDLMAAFSDRDRPLADAPAPVQDGIEALRGSSRDPVTVISSGRDGDGWEVILRRSLTVPAAEGISLAPGREAVLGISLFDNSLVDHHIVQEPIRIHLIPPVTKEIVG